MTNVPLTNPTLSQEEDDAAEIESFLADVVPAALAPSPPVPEERPRVVRARPEPERIRVVIPVSQPALGVAPLKTAEARRLAKALVKGASSWLSAVCSAIGPVELASYACWMSDEFDDLVGEVKYLASYAARGDVYPSLLGRGLSGPALPRFLTLAPCPVEPVERIFRAACARACIASLHPVRVHDLEILLGVPREALSSLARIEGALTDDGRDVHPLLALMWLAMGRELLNLGTSAQESEEPR